jgi:hypothetical protein
MLWGGRMRLWGGGGGQYGIKLNNGGKKGRRRVSEREGMGVERGTARVAGRAGRVRVPIPIHVGVVFAVISAYITHLWTPHSALRLLRMRMRTDTVSSHVRSHTVGRHAAGRAQCPARPPPPPKNKNKNRNKIEIEIGIKKSPHPEKKKEKKAPKEKVKAHVPLACRPRPRKSK